MADTQLLLSQISYQDSTDEESILLMKKAF